MAMKEKMDKALEVTLRVALVTMFVFGVCQFLVVGIMALFGANFGGMQYIASLVLFGLGITSLVALTRISAE